MSEPVESLAQIQQQAAQRIAKEEEIEQLEVEDGMAELAQDPTENTAASERAQQRHARNKNLEARKWSKAESGQDSSPHIIGLEERQEEDVAHYFQERNPELPADRLLALKKKLSPSLSSQEIQEQVVSFFSDPALADDAFAYLIQISQPPLKELIQEAKTSFFAAHQREIIGGKNITEIARDFVTEGLAPSPTPLRALYANVTGIERPHNDLFEFLSKQYSFHQLQPTVAFLLQSISYELKSEGPSIEKEKLLRLMQGVKDLESILAIYMHFQDSIPLMRRQYAELGASYPENIQFEILTKAFMNIVYDRYPTKDKVMKAVEQLGIGTDPEKVIFLSRFRDAIRNVSPRLYQNNDHPQKLNLAFISALEQLEEEDREDQIK